MFVFCGEKADAGILSGAYFSISDAGVFVEEITPGSPSYKGGLRRGDRVLSVDGRQWPSLLPDLDDTVEMDLAAGNSVILEIINVSGKRDAVWLKRPRLSQRQRRFLNYYLEIRVLLDDSLGLWEGIRGDYRNWAMGNVPLDVSKKGAIDKAAKLISLKNSLIESIPKFTNGAEWENINIVREKIASLMFLMDQETQRLFTDSLTPPGSGGHETEFKAIDRRVSDIEKYMSCSLASVEISESDLFEETSDFE